MNLHFKLRGRILAGALLTCALFGAGEQARAGAEADARVFPVRGVFWDHNEVNAIDQTFMQSLDMATLSLQIRDALAGAFAGRTGELNQKTAASTFAVSFHLTRMTTYTARKADGNIEVRTPVTGSIYFTNVQTGEILFTATSTNAALALLPAGAVAGQGLREQAHKLYGASLSALIGQLCARANESFQPRRVQTRVTALHNGLLLLSSGFKQGIQAGDDLNDEHSDLVHVLYAGADYAVAQVKIADEIKVGTEFHKFVVGAMDGRLRPRATVVVDRVPAGFSSTYVGQLFSEELGAKAPLTMVQVNQNFSGLLKSVVQQAALSTSSTVQRETPELIIRLSVSDPIIYEVKTNLAFKTVRGFESNAYAEIIDTTGRVLYTATGHDFQKIEVTNGLDLDPAARREIAIKNALLALAQKMGGLAEGKLDANKVVRTGAEGAVIASGNKVFAEKAPGYLLRATEFKIDGKSRKVLFPLAEADVGRRTGDGTAVVPKLSLGKQAQAVAPGDVFEILQLGTTPKSPVAFGLCANPENLGSIKTPDFDSIASAALARAMPGSYYAPEIRQVADKTVNGETGFREKIRWDVPPLSTCLQAVQRVDMTGEKCGEQCQKLITARYTMRVLKDGVVGARVGLESKFQTSGFEKASSQSAVASLIQSDLIDEAQKLLSGVAEKIILTTTH